MLMTSFVVISFTSCFTGVESTSKITVGRTDKKDFQRSPEAKFLENLHLPVVGEWQLGKEFEVIDSKVSILFDRRSLPQSGEAEIILPEKTILRYAGLDSIIQAGGKYNAVILFDLNGQICRLPINKTTSESKRINIRSIPMLADLSVVSAVDSIMRGAELFTKTALWYDQGGNELWGKKFIKIIVDSVIPGDLIFPLKVNFHTAERQCASVMMNFGYMPNESRSFDALFNLSDIRKNYPTIKDEVWQLITESKVRESMTKEECRLSLGNPTEVDRGHNWSQTLEIWKYSDGKYLRFADGVLLDYK